MKTPSYWFLIIFHLFIYSLYAQENTTIPKWEIIGDESFPEIDQKWYRANGICGMGQVRSIFVDPKDKNHLIIGSYGGGIWETFNALTADNKSVKWKSLTDTIFANTIDRILMLDDYIYASTSSRIASRLSSSMFEPYGLGVIKKHKDSSHWEIPDFKFSCKYFDVVKSNGNKIIYAINRQKVFKSINNGTTWTELNGINRIIKDKNIYLHRVIINPLDPEIVFVFPNNSTDTLFKTTDGGKTWEDASNIFEDMIDYDFKKSKSSTMPYFDEKENRLYIALHTKNYAFIVSSADWNNFDIYNKSTKRGLRVSSMKNTAFFKINDTDFFFGATQLHRLNNGESSINLSRNKIHDDIRDIKYYYDKNTDEHIYYFGHDGGIAISKDYGKTYINISGNLNLFQIHNMAYNNYNNHRIITIGVQDGSWYRIDRDGSNKWDAIEMCCEGGVHTQPDNPNVVYFVNNGRLTRADNGVDYPIENKNSITRIQGPDTPIAIHPSDYNTIVYATYGWPNSKLKISYNKGDSDEILNVNNLGELRGRPTAMAFNESDPSTFYMASLYYTPNTNPQWVLENHLYKTENLDANPNEVVFTDIIESLRSTNPDVIDKSAITSIEVFKGNIWICFGNLDKGKKIYYSNNAGEDWQNISYNLPNTPANIIKYVPSIDKLFLGTDIGIFTFDGVNWEKYGKDLPTAIVTDIEIDTISNEILVSLYGRSVWVTELPIADKNKTHDNITISKDTRWTTEHIISGNLIIDKGVKLTIKNTDIKVSNIILKKKAEINWKKGNLSPYNSPSKSNLKHSNMILNKRASVLLENVRIQNFEIQVTKKSNIKQIGVSLENSHVHYLKRRNF